MILYFCFPWSCEYFKFININNNKYNFIIFFIYINYENALFLLIINYNRHVLDIVQLIVKLVIIWNWGKWGLQGGENYKIINVYANLVHMIFSDLFGVNCVLQDIMQVNLVNINVKNVVLAHFPNNMDQPIAHCATQASSKIYQVKFNVNYVMKDHMLIYMECNNVNYVKSGIIKMKRDNKYVDLVQLALLMI